MGKNSVWGMYSSLIGEHVCVIMVLKLQLQFDIVIAIQAIECDLTIFFTFGRTRLRPNDIAIAITIAMVITITNTITTTIAITIAIVMTIAIIITTVITIVNISQ